MKFRSRRLKSRTWKPYSSFARRNVRRSAATCCPSQELLPAKPPVILADEPTGNLDTKSTKEVMAILHELKDEGRTVIVITHDNEIAEEAERVIRIRDGKVVEELY